LQHVDIYVGKKLCASDVSVGEGSTLSVPCDGIGSEIKVQHKDIVTTLTLCGFAAFGEEEDIAQIPYSAMTATQSSDYGWQNYGVAALALTAAPQTTWPGTCTHTAVKEEAAPWWKVTLNGVWHVHKVQLTSRDQCCPERLQHVDIYVGTTLCASDVSVGEGSTLTVPCDGIGSEIKVQHKDIITTLTLCGFAAFGEEEVGGSS